jgi:hypothetical protein
MAGGRSSNITNLRKAGITFVFNEESKIPREKQYPLIVTQIEEPKPVGIYMTAGDIGNATLHTEGAAIRFEGIDEAYKTEITLLTYEKGVSATKRQMDDDQTNTVRNIAQKLIPAMLKTKEQVCADVYNHGFTTTVADAVYMFHDSHPLTNSAKLNDNLLTGDLSTDNIKAGINQFHLIYDMAGNQFGSKATHLLANTMQQFDIFELLNSDKMAWDLTNTINSLNSAGKLGIILNDYIDHKNKGDTYSPWFMLDKTLPKAGVVLQTRGGMKQDAQEDFKTKDWQITCLEEYAAADVSPGYGLVGSLGT